MGLSISSQVNTKLDLYPAKELSAGDLYNALCDLQCHSLIIDAREAKCFREWRIDSSVHISEANESKFTDLVFNHGIHDVWVVFLC